MFFELPAEMWQEKRHGGQIAQYLAHGFMLVGKRRLGMGDPLGKAGGSSTTVLCLTRAGSGHGTHDGRVTPFELQLGLDEPPEAQTPFPS